MLKLVLPKGSLEQATFDLFDAADLTLSRSSSVDYKATIDDPRVADVRILRPQEIPQYVEEGLFDLGITGRDWIEETGSSVVSLGELGYSKATAKPIRVVVAVAHDSRSSRYYAVQMFGRPGALRTRFEISNRSEQTVRYQLGDQRFTLPPRVTREHEQCVTLTLSLELPGHPWPTTLQPANGASYRIEAGNSSLRLVRH